MSVAAIIESGGIVIFPDVDERGVITCRSATKKTVIPRKISRCRKTPRGFRRNGSCGSRHVTESARCGSNRTLWVIQGFATGCKRLLSDRALWLARDLHTRG